MNTIDQSYFFVAILIVLILSLFSCGTGMTGDAEKPITICHRGDEYLLVVYGEPFRYGVAAGLAKTGYRCEQQ